MLVVLGHFFMGGQDATPSQCNPAQKSYISEQYTHAVHPAQNNSGADL